MKHLSTATVQSLVNEIREGQRIALICYAPLEGFTVGRSYPIVSIALGRALRIVDDFGIEMDIGEDSQEAECFTILREISESSPIAVEEFKQAMQQVALSAARFSEKTIFAVGDAVVWKTGMQVSNAPAIQQPAIVLEILSKPVETENAHPLDPVRTLRCDMVIGFLSPDGVFITGLADSRRFERAPMQPVIPRAGERDLRAMKPEEIELC